MKTLFCLFSIIFAIATFGINSTYAQSDITNTSNTSQQIQKDGIEIYDTDYCQKNMSATAQRVCGKTDLLCQEHKGENEFWDGFCKTFPEELNKIK